MPCRSACNPRIAPYHDLCTLQEEREVSTAPLTVRTLMSPSAGCSSPGSNSGTLQFLRGLECSQERADKMQRLESEDPWIDAGMLRHWADSPVNFTGEMTEVEMVWPLCCPTENAPHPLGVKFADAQTGSASTRVSPSSSRMCVLAAACGEKLAQCPIATNQAVFDNPGSIVETEMCRTSPTCFPQGPFSLPEGARPGARQLETGRLSILRVYCTDGDARRVAGPATSLLCAPSAVTHEVECLFATITLDVLTSEEGVSHVSLRDAHGFPRTTGGQRDNHGVVEGNQATRQVGGAFRQPGQHDRAASVQLPSAARPFSDQGLYCHRAFELDMIFPTDRSACWVDSEQSTYSPTSTSFLTSSTYSTRDSMGSSSDSAPSNSLPLDSSLKSPLGNGTGRDTGRGRGTGNDTGKDTDAGTGNGTCRDVPLSVMVAPIFKLPKLPVPSAAAARRSNEGKASLPRLNKDTFPWTFPSSDSRLQQAYLTAWNFYFQPFIQELDYLITCLPHACVPGEWDLRTYTGTLDRMVEFLHHHSMWHTLSTLLLHVEEAGFLIESQGRRVDRATLLLDICQQSQHLPKLLSDNSPTSSAGFLGCGNSPTSSAGFLGCGNPPTSSARFLGCGNSPTSSAGFLGCGISPTSSAGFLGCGNQAPAQAQAGAHTCFNLDGHLIVDSSADVDCFPGFPNELVCSISMPSMWSGAGAGHSVDSNTINTVDTNTINTVDTNTINTADTNTIDTADGNTINTADSNTINTIDTNTINTADSNTINTVDSNTINTADTNSGTNSDCSDYSLQDAGCASSPRKTDSMGNGPDPLRKVDARLKRIITMGNCSHPLRKIDAGNEFPLGSLDRADVFCSLERSEDFGMSTSRAAVCALYPGKAVPRKDRPGYGKSTGTQRRRTVTSIEAVDADTPQTLGAPRSHLARSHTSKSTQGADYPTWPLPNNNCSIRPFHFSNSWPGSPMPRKDRSAVGRVVDGGTGTGTVTGQNSPIFSRLPDCCSELSMRSLVRPIQPSAPLPSHCPKNKTIHSGSDILAALFVALLVSLVCICTHAYR